MIGQGPHGVGHVHSGDGAGGGRDRAPRQGRAPWGTRGISAQKNKLFIFQPDLFTWPGIVRVPVLSLVFFST
jgi:hypothetical protein